MTVKSAFFYADGGMVVSTDLGWLQSAIDTMMGIFDQIGLRKKLRKTVGMVCRPYQTSKVRTDKAYTRQMAGEGQTYK